jgi:hypothetical protein
MAGTDLIRVECPYCEGSEWDVWGDLVEFVPFAGGCIELPDGRKFVPEDGTDAWRCPNCLRYGRSVTEDE